MEAFVNCTFQSATKAMEIAPKCTSQYAQQTIYTSDAAVWCHSIYIEVAW